MLSGGSLCRVLAMARSGGLESTTGTAPLAMASTRTFSAVPFAKLGFPDVGTKSYPVFSKKALHLVPPAVMAVPDAVNDAIADKSVLKINYYKENEDEDWSDISHGWTVQEYSPNAFEVKATPGAMPGEYRVKASVVAGGAVFTRGFQVVDTDVVAPSLSTPKQSILIAARHYCAIEISHDTESGGAGHVRRAQDEIQRADARHRAS